MLARWTRIWWLRLAYLDYGTRFIGAYRAHRLERERQILAELAKGPRTIGEIVPVLYAAVDPRLHPAAARSVFAHLKHLATQGAVRSDGPPGPLGVYRIS